MKVHNIPSLNPLQLFRAPHPPQQQQQARAGVLPEQRGAGVPKVPSLLFEIELEEAPVRSEAIEDTDTQGVLTNFRSLAVPWSKTEHELLAEWVSVSDASQTSMQTLHALAARLRSLDHTVSIRTALGGGWGGECLRNLRHSFLVCTVAGKEGHAVYIIDPAFREQFSVAHPTLRYKQILEAVPATFVGTEDRLVSLVKALCAELQSVFMEQDATLPPWRDVAAQLSKWRPRRSTDLAVMQEEELAVGKRQQRQQQQQPQTLHLTATVSAAVPAPPAAPVPLPASESSDMATPPAETAAGLKKASSGGRASYSLPGGSLYQRVAAPVQQFVAARTSSQPGLLLSGL